ncbi:MAG: Arc/MetJ-type ribon-helix-helix transcriptional regulator [Planctomycetota bacterium]|jgi:Arc/MetJ-type ribon-helix-helix transcriptional regulator
MRRFWVRALAAEFIFESPAGKLALPVPNPQNVVRESKVTVKIPRPLYRKIQQVVEDSGFNSPTDFIVYVLRDLMGEADPLQVTEFNQDELDDIKRKLKNLGYL